MASPEVLAHDDRRYAIADDLFAPAVVLSGCHARVQQKAPSLPVFRQCREPTASADTCFCRAHARERVLGDWDTTGLHRGVPYTNLKSARARCSGPDQATVGSDATGRDKRGRVRPKGARSVGRRLLSVAMVALAGADPSTFTTTSLMEGMRTTGQLTPDLKFTQLDVYASLLGSVREYEQGPATVGAELERRFSGACDLVQREEFRATITRISTRVNWMLLSVVQLQDLVERDLDYDAGSLSGQRLTIAGALRRELRRMNKPEAHQYMFAAPKVLPDTCCKAMCRCKGKVSPHPVLFQCVRRPMDGGAYCANHALRESREFGDWAPLTMHPGLTEKAREAAWKIACLRYDKLYGNIATRAVPSVASVGTRAQKEFVMLTPAEQRASQLRRFTDTPVALPPHPCMLCDAAFGREADWRVHVAVAHRGMCMYRQRLIYLSEQFGNVGRVPPQLWRHAVEAYTEEYVTGSNSWSCLHVGWLPAPSKAAEWTQVEGQRQPTHKQYCDCAERIAKWLCGRCRPWADPPMAVPMGEVCAEAQRVVAEVVPPAELGGDGPAFLQFVLDRMVSDKLLSTEAGEAGADFVRPNADLALSMASMSLLQKLPARGDFSPTLVLPRFLRDVVDVPDDAANAWALTVLKNLEQLRLVERVPLPPGASHACVAGGAASGADAADIACMWRRPAWWLHEGGVEPTRAVHTSNVRLDCLHGDPTADHCRGSGRRRVRTREACVVCARLGWDREYGYLWRQPPGSGRKSVIEEKPDVGMSGPRSTVGMSGPPGGRAQTEAPASHGAEDFTAEVGTPSPIDARARLAGLLSPERYRQRWSFATSPDDEASGGIPREELEASAVRDPATGKLWLLHKKMFRMIPVDDGHGNQMIAADPDQEVPFCRDCLGSLRKTKPQMPKYALANDLWLGQLPAPLRGLSLGAWMMLALARPLIHKITCYPDG